MSYNGRVSVTIVTFNSGRFIKRCLESVLAQRYANREIIVIDNASTDGTADILEQFEDRCQIVYNDENIGFAAAFYTFAEIALIGAVLFIGCMPETRRSWEVDQAALPSGRLSSRISREPVKSSR